MPAEAVSCVWRRISARMSRATSLASAMPFRFSVTSRYASSSDSGSISGVYAAKIARIWRDTSLYTSKRGFTNTSSGHLRRATAPDMAERTPNCRAS